MPAKERQNVPRDEQIYTGRKGTNMQRLTTQEFTSESEAQTEKVHLFFLKSVTVFWICTGYTRTKSDLGSNTCGNVFNMK